MTMFMAAVIITVGIAFNWLVKEHMKASEALKIKSESILKARSAYDTLIYLMLSGSLSQREIRIDAHDEISPLTRIPVDGQKVSLAPDIFVQVQDSNGKLSLATVNQTAMERLIRTIGGREGFLLDPRQLSRLDRQDDFFPAQRSRGILLPGPGAACAPKLRHSVQGRIAMGERNGRRAVRQTGAQFHDSTIHGLQPQHGRR